MVILEGQGRRGVMSGVHPISAGFGARLVKECRMSDNNQQPPHDQDDVRIYEKLISRTEELLQSGRKTLEEALKKSADELQNAGDYTREKTERIMSYVRRDIQHLTDHADKARQSFREAFEPSRVSAGVQSLFTKILSSTSETLGAWARKSEQRLEFKTGELTSPGTLTCLSCGEEMHIRKTGRIPPCPSCHKTIFRKSY